MAPIIKTSLALLSVSAALIPQGVAAKKHNHNYGRHMKMAKRGSLFEELQKRADEFAPFGYDRCQSHRPAPFLFDSDPFALSRHTGGVARKKPYVKKPSASPQPSSKWKPCPPGTPVYELTLEGQGGQQKPSSDPAPPTTSGGEQQDNEDDDDEESYSTDIYDVGGEWDSLGQTAAPSSTAAGGGDSNGNGATDGAAPVTSSWLESSSSWVESSAEPTQASEAPATSPKAEDTSEDIPVATISKGVVHIGGNWGNPETAPAPAPSTSAPAQEEPKPAPQPEPKPETPSTGGWQEGQGMLGVAWDWKNASASPILR